MSGFWKLICFIAITALLLIQVDSKGCNSKGCKPVNNTVCDYICKTTGDTGAICLPGNFSKTSVKCTWTLQRNHALSKDTLLVFDNFDLSGDDKFSADQNNSTLVTIQGAKKDVFSMVIGCENETFDIVLDVGSSTYSRDFHVFYNHNGCNAPISGSKGKFTSPTFHGNFTSDQTCNFNIKIFELNGLDTLSYSLVNNTFSDKAATWKCDKELENYPADGDRICENKIGLKLSIKYNSNNTANNITFAYESVTQACSGIVKVTNGEVNALQPFNVPGNASSLRCRWLVYKLGDPPLSLSFPKMPSLPFQELVVLDGLTKKGPIKFQAAASIQQKVPIFSSSKSFFVNYETSLPIDSGSPLDFQGFANGKDIGGYLNGSGELNFAADKIDKVYMLEVNQSSVVQIIFNSKSHVDVGSLKFYSNFLAQEPPFFKINHDNSLLLKQPIVSPSSQLMVVADGFDTSKNFVSGNFSGVPKGCNEVSYGNKDIDSFSVYGNCTNVCTWTIPPDNKNPNSYLTLDLLITKPAGKANVAISSITEKYDLAFAGDSYIPPVNILASVGTVVSFTRDCSQGTPSNLALQATYRKLRECHNPVALIPGVTQTIQSPLFPDNYPLNTNCTWQVSSSKNSSNVYVSFKFLKLAEGHTLYINKIPYNVNSSLNNADDNILTAPFDITFSSLSKNKTETATGFSLELTALDCGGNIKGNNGSINTDGYPNTVTKDILCMWMITVDKMNKTGYNAMTVEVAFGNNSSPYPKKFTIFDGPSMREPNITLNKSGRTWTRRNVVIVQYLSDKAEKGVKGMQLKYTVQNCTFGICNNSVCLQDGWKCNGVNDCGDWSDEINCNSTVPLPPTPSPTPTPEVKSNDPGVLLGVLIPLSFLLGIASAFGVPLILRRLRGGPYRQFQDVQD